MDNLDDPLKKCQGGADIFEVIMDRLWLAIIEGIENVINFKFIEPFNAIPLVPNLPLVCIPGQLFGLDTNYKKCPKDDNYWESFLGCSIKNTHEPHKMCYFKCASALDPLSLPSACVTPLTFRGPLSLRRRQRAICMASGNKASAYKALFEAPNAADLTAQFHSIVGDAFETLPPTMLQAFEQVNALQAESGINFNPEAARICDNSLEGSMSLDEARARPLPPPLHCRPVSAPVPSTPAPLARRSSSPASSTGSRATAATGSPPSASKPSSRPSTGGCPTWSGTGARPRPRRRPSPARAPTAGSWPATRRASSSCARSCSSAGRRSRTSRRRSTGATSASTAAATGAATGPSSAPPAAHPPFPFPPPTLTPRRSRSYVSRYSMSTAYLSTVNFEDQDSLSARLVQARFSGMFRFSCACFRDFMSDPTTAAAGVGEGTDASARADNPPDYGRCALTPLSPLSPTLHPPLRPSRAVAASGTATTSSTRRSSTPSRLARRRAAPPPSTPTPSGRTTAR